MVKKYLESKGWNVIKFNKIKTDKGHDLEAMYGNDHIILECKGFPRSTMSVDQERVSQSPRIANFKHITGSQMFCIQYLKQNLRILT